MCICVYLVNFSVFVSDVELEFMAKTNPARGMRDFLPVDVRKREYVIGIIKQVYESYGYEPLETPAVENIETLMGKYGEEGNQLVFKILKRGEKLSESLQRNRVSELQSSESSGTSETSITSANSLSDLALRYDLTVPLARVVADRRNELPKFFKRYQIQPVWRADRPARGRFREFYQCDVDAIGSESVAVEGELISAVSEVLDRLEFEDFHVKINHRGLLTGILDSLGIPAEKHALAVTSLDKVYKIGTDEVIKELGKHNLATQFQRYFKLIGNILGERGKLFRPVDGGEVSVNQVTFADYNTLVIEQLERTFGKDERVRIGLDSIKNVLAVSRSNRFNRIIEVDPLLARGLSYYTGLIMEIVLADTDFPVSIAGGGRYDALIGMFGKEQIPACGFSLGLERILVVMDVRNMWERPIAEGKLKLGSAEVMVTIWNQETIAESLKLADELRKQNLRVLVYPEADKLGKQIKYADSIGVPFVCVLGESELAENKVTVKDMESGQQDLVERAAVVDKIRA